MFNYSKYLPTFVYVAFFLALGLMQSGCASDADSKPKVDWDIQISNGDYNQPVSVVALNVNGNRFEISSQIDAPMEVIDRQSFAEKGVPETAVTACGGFWAGFEQVLYIDSVSNGLEAVLLTYEEGFDTPQKAVLKTFQPK